MESIGIGKAGKAHKSQHIKLTAGERAFGIVNGVFLTLLCLVMVYPFWYVLVLSFTPGSAPAR